MEENLIGFVYTSCCVYDFILFNYMEQRGHYDVFGFVSSPLLFLEVLGL